MKKSTFEIIALFILNILLCAGCNKKGHTVLFEPNYISTAAVEYSCTFSASGKEVYFARSNHKWGSGNSKSSIYYAKEENGKWTTPKLASFSGQHDDSDPHLTSDGKRLYFTSKRPAGQPAVSADIWLVEKNDNGAWGAAIRLPDPINSPGTEYSPRTDGRGHLYFASDRSGGYGQGDLYVAQNRAGKLAPPVNMGNTINSALGEWNLEVNNDGNLIIFEASQRQQNVTSYGDLYITFKIAGVWTIPQHIAELNTGGSDLYPYLTKEQDRLYYASSDSLKGQSTNIYVTDFQRIYDKYKPLAQIPLQYLFVVNRSSHDLTLINLTHQKLIKRIPTGIGPHEMTISKDNKYAFVADYGSYPKPHNEPITSKQLKWVEDPQNTITKVDLSDLSTQTFTIPGSVSHHGILTNHDGSRVWITAENEGIVKEIDGTTGTVLKEYTTLPGSHIIKSNFDYSRLFVSNIESNAVSAIDLATQKVTNIPTPKGPEGMEITPDGEYLWVLCNNANKIMVLNAKSLMPVKTFDAEGKFPVKLTFINNEAWVANVFSKKISIFDAATFEFKEHLELPSTPLGITSSQANVFITLPRKNTVQVYDSKSRKKIMDYTHGMEQDGMFIVNDVVNLLKAFRSGPTD